MSDAAAAVPTPAAKLEVAVNELLLQGCTLDDILGRVHAIVAMANRLTEAELEARNYTYVQCFVQRPPDQEREETFLVATPHRAAAKTRAWKYINDKGWKLDYIDNGGRKLPFHLYPRNYIAKARELYKQNKFI